MHISYLINGKINQCIRTSICVIARLRAKRNMYLEKNLAIWIVNSKLSGKRKAKIKLYV